jgi:DNA (cytosine-5)-methyltransferase 1
MREWGYDVKVEILNAEQYGVPQTRKRAILVARRGGPVHLPRPTHSRYYSNNPAKLDDGVKKWVSMGSALGFAGFTAEKVMGRGMVERYGTRPGRESTNPAFAIRASAGGMEPGGFVLRSNYGTGGDPSKRGERKASEPSATLTSKADRMKWDGVRRLTAEEASALQSYPQGFTWTGKRFLQIGNAVPPLLAEHILAALLGIREGR